MSRIGNAPVVIPEGVEVKVDGNTVTAKGPKGTLTRTVDKNIAVQVKDGEILFTRPDDNKKNRSLHGLSRSLVANIVEGVLNGFKKELEVNGVGYRVLMQGSTLVMNIGFSHQIEYAAPEGITIETPEANKIVVTGADKQKVGQVAAEIRGYRPPEPYKGKGIRYVDEYVRRKEGKAGKSTTA